MVQSRRLAFPPRRPTPPSFVSIRVDSWFNLAALHFLHAAQHPPHSCRFVLIRGSIPPHLHFLHAAQHPPSFVPIRVHSWFNPAPLAFPPRRPTPPSFVPIRVDSWFDPAPLHFLPTDQHPRHSCPFVLIRGSIPPPCISSTPPNTPLIRVHSCSFVVPARPPCVSSTPPNTPLIRVHSC